MHRGFRIAGRAVDFQFAGGRWADELTRAFAHLEPPAPSDSPEDSPEKLAVSVWDGAAAPRNHVLRAYLFSLTNWWFEYTGPRGELLDIHDERLSATYHPDTGTLSVVDLQRGAGFYWKRDDSPMPYYESCAPFRSLLHSWMRGGGAQFVHGAAVGTAQGGVLLVGKGGSGKSTSALACLGSSLRVAGDDYCILESDLENDARGDYQVHSLYCTAKVVGNADLDRFPALAGSVVNTARKAGEKVAISLHQNTAGVLIGHFPLRAILVPVVTGMAETRIVDCPAGDALMAMAPSTLSQLPVSGRDDLRFLGQMARRVPCYRLLLGRDIQKIPVKIHALLKSLGVERPVSEDALVAAD